jgi:two-component system, NtrC family, sensor histidine kinase PilS
LFANFSSRDLSAGVAKTLQRREIYFFSLYRILEAGLFALVAFSPVGMLLARQEYPWLAKSGAVTYLLIAGFFMWASTRSTMRIRRQIALGLVFDLSAAATVLFAFQGLDSGVCLLLIFNIAAAGLILSMRASVGFALVASLLVLGNYILNRVLNIDSGNTAAEAAMFSVTYVAAALLFQLISRQMSETEALAEKRGEELANLSEINELVIRRMRTGILVVDGGHRVRLANEAAWALLGNPSPDRRSLNEVAPQLHESLWKWRRNRNETPKAMTLADTAPEVLPRFVSINVTDHLFLIFLDDSRIYSVRAEELTLSTLGRLSASIAHEIRNPLAAISYSAQLLDESVGMPEADKRLLEIIHSQCHRMNGIVENILGLARRERSQPESIELTAFTRRFVEEYRQNHPLETDVMQAVNESRLQVAMADPQHLHQVLTALVHNALSYGREPGKPAQVTVSVRKDKASGAPLIEVIDRGPGIPVRVAEQLFTPFYTTSEHGTGLGLYIAKQLCEANQCTLQFEPVPGGGACFRITMQSTQNLMSID